MFKKKSLPEEGEFVICTVRKVNPHSVVCSLDEYENVEGIIYTSEMERRVVRNIRVFFKVGGQIVCKVMDVDEKTRFINLSLKRVGEGQRRTKVVEWRNERRADELLQAFAKQCKIKPEEVYKKFVYAALRKYGSVYPCLIEIVKSEGKLLKNLCQDKRLSEKLCNFLKARLSIPKTEIRGLLIMQSNAPDGIKIIKDAVLKAKDAVRKEDAKVSIKYVGSPKYQLVVEAKKPKIANKVLETVLQTLEKNLKKTGFVEFRVGKK